MLGFGKNKKARQKSQSIQTVSAGVTGALAEQIHIMPQQFYVKPKTRHFGLTLVIIIGALALVALALVALYLTKSFNQPAPTTTATTTESITPSQPVDTQPDQTSSAQTTLPDDDLIVGQPTDPATTSPATSTPAQADDSTVDHDGDGLTQAEEKLFNTQSQVADTDADGYSDGSEILHGYDPLVESKTVLETGLFKLYSDKLFTINYPSLWTINQSDSSQTQTLFTADSGEFVEVLVLDNPSGQSVTAWFTQQFPELSQTNQVAVTINNTTGVLHPNGLVYYLAKPGDQKRIFVVTYNTAGSSQLKYQTTFRAMANSFKAL